METPSTVQAPIANPPAPNPPGERVAKAAQILNGRKTEKPRGRPPTPGSPHSKFNSTGQAPANGGGSLPFAPGVIEKGVRSICATIDRYVQRRTHGAALVLTREKALADAFAAEVAMDPEEREQMATLSEIVCQQYKLAGQHAPLAFLVMHATGYATKVGLTLNRLDQIAKFNAGQNKAKRPPENESSSQ